MMLEACLGPALQMEPLLEVTRAHSSGEESNAMASSNRRRVVDKAKCEANVAVHSQIDVGGDDIFCGALLHSMRQESKHLMRNVVPLSQKSHLLAQNARDADDKWKSTFAS